MSSTGLTNFYAIYLNSDIIDVNQNLIVNNNHIDDLIDNNFHDLSGNIKKLSVMIYLNFSAI